MPLPYFMIDDIFGFWNGRIVGNTIWQIIFKVLGDETIGDQQ
jgi:hypothetical protein